MNNQFQELVILNNNNNNNNNNNLAELAKKIEIFNSLLNIDRKRNITILNTTELSDNEKTDKHIRNTICHKCKQYDILRNNVIDIIKLLNKSVN